VGRNAPHVASEETEQSVLSCVPILNPFSREGHMGTNRCALWATVPCKNLKTFSLRKEPLW
jgi:hypothetical protein